MEVYTPETDNFYEERSDVTSTVVNKRRNYENLRRSIEAHKNRLAMARIKKGKNLPTDDLLKNDNTGCCRQSTADTNEEYERYRFRRHTQSSMNKLNKPVKYNSLASLNSLEGRYDNERLYIKKYEELQAKEDESGMRYNTNITENLSNKSEFSFDPNAHKNQVALDDNELEKKVVEILGKLLLKTQNKPNVEALSQYQKNWNEKPTQEPEKYDQVSDLLVKCISTTLNSAKNEVNDNLSIARTNKSVNVEINLNMQSAKEREPPIMINMTNEEEEVGTVLIENVFDKDTKVVEDGAFKTFFNKFKFWNGQEKKDTSRTHAKEFVNVNQKKVLAPNQPWIYPNVVTQNKQNVVNGKAARVVKPTPNLWNENQKNVINAPNVKNPEQLRHFARNPTPFRPFSRSRSQSMNMQAKRVLPVNPVIGRTNTIFQQPVNNQVNKNGGFVPLRTSHFGASIKNEEPPKTEQEEFFNPFNLDQPAKVAKSTNVFKEQQTSKQQLVNGFNNVPVVNRRANFTPFNRRNSTRNRVNTGMTAFMQNYQDNFTERIERGGVNCFGAFGMRRQGTNTKFVRTQNMTKPWEQQGAQQIQHPMIPVQNQVPVGFNKVKRINTDPNNFKQSQVNGQGVMSRRQFTGIPKTPGSEFRPKVKLVKSQSIINTLNRLSELNSMY